MTRLSSSEATSRASPLVSVPELGVQRRPASGEAPGAEREQHDGEHRGAPSTHPPARAASRSVSRGDRSTRGHRAVLAVRASSCRRMPSRRSSRLIRAGSTACTRTPRPTRSRDQVGHRRRRRRRPRSATVNQSPSRVSAPAGAPAGPRRGRRRAVEAQPQLALAEQLGERAGGGDPALVEDDHPVADPLDLADQVRVEQHGDAARLQRQHDVADVDPAERVERAGRLVEDDELRPGDQGDGQPEALLHALGEPADPVAGAVGEADQRQALAPLGGGHVGAGRAGRAGRAPRPAVSHGW